MTEKINVGEIFQNAMKDPTLFSTINIEELLQSIENVKNDYLENKTLDTVATDIRNELKELNYPMEIQNIIGEKLIGYRLVEEINELHPGKYIRWIRRPKHRHEINTLTNGAIVSSIRFTNNGTTVGCKSGGNRFLQIRFDDCVIFQKMTAEEQLLLMAYEKISDIQ